MFFLFYWKRDVRINSRGPAPGADRSTTDISGDKVAQKGEGVKRFSIWEPVEESGKQHVNVEGLKPDSVEGRYVADMGKAVYKLQELFTEALVDASENFQSAEKNTTQEGGVKYQARRLSEDDLESYLRAGKRRNQNKVEAIENGKQIILTSEQEIVDFIGKSIKKEAGETTVAYGRVNDRLASEVFSLSKGKIRIDDYYLELIPQNIQHAYEEHSDAKEEGDIALTMEDFESLPEYLDSFTDVLYAIKYNSGSVRICVSKRISNGRILIIETVSKSRGALQFKNAIGVSEEKYNQKYLPEYKKRAGMNTRGNESSNNSLRDSSNSNTIIRSENEIVKPESVEAVDVAVDAKTESVAPSPLFSERTWTESEIAQEQVEQADRDLEAEGISDSAGSDMGVLYSNRDVTSWDINWDEDNHSTIKSQMVKHMADINRMNPVADIEFDKSKGKTYANILDEVLRTKFGYKIDRADGASFLFDKVAIATLRRYVGSDEEAAAVTAAPYVLKRGKAISGHKNHKNLGNPSVTYAGPVTINRERVNVGVVVLFGDKNRPHSLRVLMPSGKEYVLKKTETDPKRKGASPDGGVRSSTGSASKLNVAQNEMDVKKYSDRDTESVSNRSLLADALESVAQTDWEKQKLTEYKGKIQQIEAQEKKLRELNQQIRELSFAQGPRDKAKLSALRDEATKTANRINILDIGRKASIAASLANKFGA